MIMVSEDMVDENPPIVVSKREYETLKEDQRKLQALEAAGVDNWDGYGFAMEDIWSEDDDDGA